MRLAWVLLLLVACSPARAVPASTAIAKPVSVARIPADRAAHALSRFAFGPRPGDVERVAKMGVDAWLRAQLAPGRDEAVETKLAALPSLRMSIPELLDDYPRPKEADPGDRTPRDLGRELVAAKLVRAVESDRQLEEVFVDFWFNHFNVDANKGAVRWMAGAYERDAIRPFVFGKFRDLLGATAKHPAMLFYLDNWLSVAEGSKGKKGKARGLNENYARELLELHTLGVSSYLVPGGYDQNDVREVARAFTGWTIERPKVDAKFVFRPIAHDAAPKTILGQTIDAGGIADGERVLDVLAKHPSTARHLATQLARRFVSDDPPQALVDRVADAFLTSDGDLRVTYEALLFAPETWSDAALNTKVKDPFETIVSSLRAVGATLDVAKLEKVQPLIGALDAMGEPLYRCAPPTGFPEVASAWASTGALVSRIRFALALSEQRFVSFDAKKLAVGEGPLVDRVARAILHRELAPATRAAIEKELDDDDPQRAIGLVLGSPDFQRQ